MRVRAGNIKRLSGSGVVNSANDGTFAGDYGNGENLNLTDASGSVLATIDEHSGIIKNLKSGFTVSIE